MSHSKKNKAAIKKLTNQLLKEAITGIKKKIDKSLNCGALDVNSFDPENNPYVMPKTILIAAMESEADQWKGHNTSFDKEVKKGVKNLKYFI